MSDQTKQIIDTHETTFLKLRITELEQQRDQLRTELRTLQTISIYTNPIASEAFNMGHKAAEKILLPKITEERDEILAAAKKLAEALQFYAERNSYLANVAKAALAEYRAQYPKDNK
jgi:hypothetical protein